MSIARSVLRPLRLPIPRGSTIARMAGLAAAGALAAVPAGARTVPRDRSFAGECTFDGASLDASPGLTLARADHTYTLSGHGTCAGRPATLEGKLSGPANCTGSDTPAVGTGSLTVDGAAIPVKLQMGLTLPDGTIDLHGTRSGAASGTTAFGNSSNGASMPSCGGSGLRHITFDTTFATSQPLMGPSPVASPPRRPVRHGRRHHR